MDVAKTDGLQVWTADGWKPFQGVIKHEPQPLVRVEFNDDRYIEGTPEHCLYEAGTGSRIALVDMLVGDQIETDECDPAIVQSVTELDEEDVVYDLLEVADNHKFIANGVSNSNCCFISGEATLISGAKIASFRSTIREPRFVDQYGCRWYEPIQPNTPYAVVLDPSGDGVGDNAAIQVWELPHLKQVAEWNDSEPDQNEQARMLRRILMRISMLQNADETHSGVNDIYYSIERNSIGIGIIRAIEHIGEEKFPGWFIDASEVSLGSRGESTGQSGISKYRGLLTSNATKKRYAQDFKQLIERNLIQVRSKFLSSQLKQFVKSGASWAAKEGSMDDIVMSCVLMCHLIDELRFQEPDLDDYVRPIIDDYDEDDTSHPDNQAMLPVL